MDFLIHHMLLTSTERQPDKEALVDATQRLSYVHAADQSSALASGTREFGVKRGDRIGIWLETSVVQVISIFGVSESGGVFVPKKNSRGKTYLVVDGGMKHHLAASGNLGQVIKRNFPVAILNKEQSAERERVDLVGPLCTPLDVLARDADLPKAEVGDLVAVFQSGAYARTASPLDFLSHPHPAEVLVSNGDVQLIRRRGTYDDLLRDVFLVN